MQKHPPPHQRCSPRTGSWQNWPVNLAGRTSTIIAALLLAAGLSSAATTEFVVNPSFETPGSGDGAAHVAGPGDERSHRDVVPLGWWDRLAGLRANEKAAVTAIGVCGPRSRPGGPESVIQNEAV